MPTVYNRGKLSDGEEDPPGGRWQIFHFVKAVFSSGFARRSNRRNRNEARSIFSPPPRPPAPHPLIGSAKALGAWKKEFNIPVLRQVNA